MDLNLKSKVAIVTGGGRGIGRAVALTLASEGAYVAVNDIDVAAAKEVARDIISLGSISLTVPADVTKTDQVDRMVHQTLTEFERVDILINNAGIVYDDHGPITKNQFQDSVENDWKREIDLILYGTMNCTKAVLEHMIKRKRGKIVNVSSDLGKASIGVKGVSIYSTAKGGVNAFTRSIAAEVAAYDITINAVSPGMVRTTRAFLAESQKETRPKQYEYYKNLEKDLIGIIPLGRLGNPEDVAKLVVFLSSDSAAWITGQIFSVNGGLLMI